jgi:Acetyltransferase (GNAT) domain
MNVSVYTSFRQLPKSLLKVNHFPEQSSFLLSHDWFYHLYETALQQEFTPRIYVLTDVDATIPAVLYCAVPKGKRRLVSLTNFYSTEFSVVAFCTGKSIQCAVDQLASFIANESPRWSSLEFRYLKSDTEVNQILEKSLKNQGFSVNRFTQYDNWYHLMQGQDYAAYSSQRPSQLKNTLRTKTKKLGVTHRSQIKIYPKDKLELSAAIADYEQVYNASWKKNEPFPEFSPGLIQLCAKLNILLLGILYIDGTPAAAQLWFSLPEKFVIYKLAYDQKYENLSVGTILSDELFRYAHIKNNRAEIDYGIGGESYKKQWMTHVRRVHGLEAFNKKSITGFYLWLRYRAAQIVKGIIP